MTDDEHVQAHDSSSRHRAQVLTSEMCGCFYCLRTFEPSEIRKWIEHGEKEADLTALCPYCGIDSVIGSESEYPLTPEFLARMHKHWFSA